MNCSENPKYFSVSQNPYSAELAENNKNKIINQSAKNSDYLTISLKVIHAQLLEIGNR